MPSKTSALTDRQRVIVFGVLLIGSAIGLVASIVLSHEALTIAKDSSKVLGCDLNAAMSCSSVAKHWSAHVVGDIPNSFRRHGGVPSIYHDCCCRIGAYEISTLVYARR